MLSIRTSLALAQALASPIDSNLNRLLTRRRDELNEYGHDVSEHAYFLVAEPGDHLSDIEVELGFPITRNFVDGAEYGQVDYTPSWEWIARHDGYFELVFVLTDDGFGWVIFVRDHPETDATLLQLCRDYAAPPS